MKKWAEEQPTKDREALLHEIDKALASKTKPRIKAYSCRNYKVGEGCRICGNFKGDKTIKGAKLYWVKGRPYTLEKGIWGREYSETVVSLEDLKG